MQVRRRDLTGGQGQYAPKVSLFKPEGHGRQSGPQPGITSPELLRSACHTRLF